MRTLILMAVGLALIASAAPSLAQKKYSAIYPPARESAVLRGDVPRFLLGDPLAKIRARDAKSLESLGLPANIKFPGMKSATTAPVGLDRYARLDVDRDGSISRREYMLGRFRGSRAGVAGESKRLRYQARLASRFRAADRNRDGEISAEEIAKLRNPRF